VLEWTSSLYKAYPYEVVRGGESSIIQGSRVLRGGSWNYGPGDARAAYRDYGNVNGFTNFNVAVRMACGVANHSSSYAYTREENKRRL